MFLVNFLTKSFVVMFFVSDFCLQVGSVMFNEDVADAKFRAIHQDEIVPIEYLPYPESKDFYTHAVPEIQRANNRSKRAITIAYPRGASLVTDFYMNIEATNPGHVHAPLTLQARYFIQFPNITLFETGRSFVDRLSLFIAAEKMIETFGISGKLCLLRAICERSEYHIEVDGLFGEIITLLLSVGSSYEDVQSDTYAEAYDHGLNFGDCATKYAECPFSLFSWFHS